MSAKAVMCALLVAACSPARAPTMPVRSIVVGSVAPRNLATIAPPGAPAGPAMPEPARPSTHGFWWDHDVPGRAHVVGRYQVRPGAMPVVEADGGVRVKLVIHDECPFPDAVFVRVQGEAHVESAEDDVPTYVMDVSPSTGFEALYWRGDVRSIEAAHAATIDVALEELRRHKKTSVARIAVEQAAAVLDQRLEGHCDAVARCRDELALAAQIRENTVDLRTLAAVLRSYRDDPLSLGSRRAP